MKFLLSADQIHALYTTNQKSGCIASNRITVDGMRIGYMYREEASLNFPDSGWRFFAGDETDSYTENSNNFHIFDLNTICNYDSDIIDYLDSPVGTAYIRDGKMFILDN